MMMTGPTDYARQLLKISVVQILQTIGFKGTHQIPLNILVELLERYIIKLSRCSKDFSELANRTEPTLDDVASALDRFKVSPSELEEFMNWVDTPEFAIEKHAVASKAWNDVVPPRQAATATGAKFKDKLGGYCSESEAKERESDEEFEHVYDFMPVMKQQLPTATVDPVTAAAVQPPAVVAMDTTQTEKTGDQSTADVQMTSPPPALPKPTADEQRQQQQIEIIKRQLSMKAQAVVKKSGRTFSNYTWDSLFKPAIVRTESVKNIDVSMAAGGDSSMTLVSDTKHGGLGDKTNAKVPEAKMPPYYHKPRIRQRKQHLLDLAANLNKPAAAATSSASLANIAAALSSIAEPEPSTSSKPAIESTAVTATVPPEEPINPVSAVKSADEIYTALEIEKTAIELEDIPKELEGDATNAEKVAEVKQLKLKIKENQIVDPDGQANTPTADARLPAIPKLKIASLKKNLTANNATSSPMVPAAHKSAGLSNKDNTPKRTESVVFDSSQIFAIDLGLDEEEDLASSIVAESKERRQSNLDVFSERSNQSKTAAFWEHEDGGEVTVEQQPISIKIKRTKDSYNAVTSIEDGGGDRSEQQTEFNYGLDGDNFDDNAMDGIDSSSSVSKAAGNRDQPALIWKPNGNKMDASAIAKRPSNEDDGGGGGGAAPALAPFSVAAPVAKPPKSSLSLVDSTYLSSNSNDSESVSRPLGGASLMPLGTFTTTTIAEDADTRSSVLSNQSNQQLQQHRVLASKDDNTSNQMAEPVAVKSKKNKDKKKSKDKDKEKKKKQTGLESTVDQNERTTVEASMSESVGLNPGGEESKEAKQHKKKKKNKDKHKAAEKSSKEKSSKSDKKHHHEGGREKEKSKKSSSRSDGEMDSSRPETPVTADSMSAINSSSSSKKLDKKLKKQLKKQQKRLEKSAAAAALVVSITPDEVEESMHLNHELIDVETVHEHEESQAQNLINDLEAGEIRRPTPVADDLATAPVAVPRLPKIKLKLGAGSSSTTLVTQTADIVAADSPSSLLAEPPKELVKPLKISLGKKPTSELSLPKPAELTTTAAAAEEEVELGEIVRPKLSSFSQEPPKLQPHPIPKLIIKPQKPAPPSLTADDQQQQQAGMMFKLKHKDSSSRDPLIGVKKRKLHNQQSIPHLQYAPTGGQQLYDSPLADDRDVSAVDLSIEQAAFMNASGSGMNVSFSKKQRLSVSMNEAVAAASAHSPPLLTPSGQHAAARNQQAATAAQMRIVSCRTEETSQQVWICPSCKKADKGSMIGCDSCDDWYHWKCVGITREPPDDQNWYCSKCGATDQRNKAAAAVAAGSVVVGVVETARDGGSVKSETEFDDARSDTSELSVTYDAAKGELVRKTKPKQLPLP